MHGHGMNADDKGPQAPLPGAGTALALLLAINLFNYIDRQVLAAVEPEIRETLQLGQSEEDAHARFWMGLLSTAFIVTYMVIAPVFGWLSWASRWMLVGIGVVVWTLASGASGVDWGVDLATAYWLLLLTRCLVGFGEGAYGPIAPTMISDLYPLKERGKVLAWFYAAIPVGGALGYTLGEAVMRAYGWRWAFYCVVPPGLALGLWCFLMRDPPRGQADAVQEMPPRKAGLADYAGLLWIPSYTLNTLGMTVMTFAIGALAFWMPDYLKQQRVEDMFGLGPRTLFGAITALSGLVATLLGGLAGDWLRPRFSGSYFLVSGLAMLLGFPMLLLFLWTPFPWAWLFVFAAVFCLFFNTGPTNTILANVTHPAERAMGFALNILIIHALGDAISPPVVGFVADRTSMRFAFGVVSVLMLLGGLLWLWGVHYLERDTALAPTRLGK
jgi:MFS family permease